MLIRLYFQYRGYILRYEAQPPQRQDTAMVRLCTNARVQHQLQPRKTYYVPLDVGGTVWIRV